MKPHHIKPWEHNFSKKVYIGTTHEIKTTERMTLFLTSIRLLGVLCQTSDWGGQRGGQAWLDHTIRLVETSVREL